MEKEKFEGDILILGYGSIAQAVLPLIRHHFNSQTRVSVLSRPSDFAEENEEALTNVVIHEHELTRENYKLILSKRVKRGDVLVNLTAEVSSIDLMQFCSENGVLYLDTCIEMWPDETTINSRTYEERKLLLNLQKRTPKNSTTVLSSMGANPGIVSLLTKRALLLMAQERDASEEKPRARTDWAKLAKQLSVKAIHVNERDTQYSSEKVSGNDFFSTWSVDAMIMESVESAEMSLGTHEEVLPSKAKFCDAKNKRAIYFEESGMNVKAATWLPLAGEVTGMILNHNEPYSIADLYTLEDEYSPTVCFVYHPCDQAMESLNNVTAGNYRELTGKLLLHDIEDGRDELGVLIMTEEHDSLWLGSKLDIHAARSINPKSSATSLQVAGGVIAGMCWLVRNPECGVIEPEDIDDYDFVLGIAEKYWGGYVFKKTSWLPNPDQVDKPLQFKHFIR